MFQGDPVAAVAADTEERAIDAARLVKVAYEVLPHVANVEQALAGRRAGGVHGRQHAAGRRRRRPAISTPASSRRRTSSKQTYSTHVITHVCLETHGTRLRVGRRQADGVGLDAGRASARAAASRRASRFRRPTSASSPSTWAAASAASSQPDAQGLICAQAGAGRRRLPVKLMLDRKEEHLDTGNRPSATAQIKAGVSADGMLTAFDAQSWGTGGAGAASGFPLPYIYQFPNRRRTHKDVFINAGQQRRCARRAIRRAASSPKS